MHVDAICEHLQAVTENAIRTLIINLPPGHAKSLLMAVFWLAWAWLRNPEGRWLFSSNRLRDPHKAPNHAEGYAH